MSKGKKKEKKSLSRIQKLLKGIREKNANVLKRIVNCGKKCIKNKNKPKEIEI